MAVKMSLLFLPIMIVILLTDEITFNSMEQSIYNETIGSSIESLGSVSVYLDGDISNLSNVFSVLNKEMSLKNYVYYYSKDVYVSGRGVDIETALTNQLRTFSSTLLGVSSLGVISSQYRVKQYIINGRSDLMPPLTQIARAGLSFDTVDILPLTDYGSNCMLYVYPTSNGPLSYVLFAVLDETYLQTLIDNCGRKNVDYTIYDGERMIFSTDMDQESLTDARQAVRRAESLNGQTVRVLEMDGSTYIVSSIATMGWTIVSAQANPYPYNAIAKAHRASVSSRLLVMALTVALFFIIVVNFSKRLKEINRTMEKIEGGDLDSRFSPVYSDEISRLGMHLNNMMAHIRAQAEEIGRKQMQVKEAQLRALQNQINPHFLYNMLEHIRMQAIANSDTQVAKLVKIMGDMLRYNIQNDLGTVTVRQEYDQVERYLAMQKCLLGDRLNIIFDTDESVMDCRVVKFLLQPLVENSIIHGISTKISPSDLLVRIKDDGDRIDFEISDTGTGITPEGLELIHATLAAARQPDTTSGSVGLRNVNDRLVLFYGRSSALHIDSVDGVSTTITFSIPAAMEDTP